MSLVTTTPATTASIRTVGVRRSDSSEWMSRAQTAVARSTSRSGSLRAGGGPHRGSARGGGPDGTRRVRAVLVDADRCGKQRSRHLHGEGSRLSGPDRSSTAFVGLVQHDLVGRVPSLVVRHRHPRGLRPTTGRAGRITRRWGSSHPHIPAGAYRMKRVSEIPWKTVSTKPIYRNRWLSLREDLVELPDGRTTIYGVVSCGECVGVLPFLDPDTVLLVRQYRYVAGRPTWEMPTGGVHAGEAIEAAAQRELAEEVGYRAAQLTHVSTYHTSKSVMDETAHLFLGEGMVQLALPPDDTEFIESRPFPFQDVMRMVQSGEIVDGMTIIAVLQAARMETQGPWRRRG